MRYAVYADMSRSLTSQERSAIFEALEESVPGSGCVGPQKDTNDEVYFSIDAASEEEAGRQATWYMKAVFERIGLKAEYTISLQTVDGG